MGYGRRNPSPHLIMDKVMMSLYGMWIHMETQLLLGTPWIMTWAMKVSLYMVLSDGTVEHRRRYINSPPQMGRLAVA